MIANKRSSPVAIECNQILELESDTQNAGKIKYPLHTVLLSNFLMFNKSHANKLLATFLQGLRKGERDHTNATVRLGLGRKDASPLRKVTLCFENTCVPLCPM